MTGWTKMMQTFDQWSSPLRPCAEDVELYRNFLPSGGKTLLLGVTPELQPLATVAVDNNSEVIAQLASSEHIQTVLADWSDLPFEAEFDTIIGDGCLNVFQGTSQLFFAQMKKALKKNGRLILRLFVSPEEKEGLEEVLRLRETMGFHAYKWKVAHALANPYVPVQTIYDVIQPIHDHPTLGVYKDSKLIYYFPKLTEMPAWDGIHFASSYELAERCPVIMWKLG